MYHMNRCNVIRILKKARVLNRYTIIGCTKVAPLCEINAIILCVH